MSLNFIWKLGFKIQKTSVKAQKIDDSILNTFEIVIADFQMKDKANKPRFFQKLFLIIDINFEMILKIFFLKISNIDILFSKKIFT